MTISDAWLNGWHAHKDKIKTSENPYNERTQQASYSQWESGWCQRFSRHKHDKEDPEEFDFNYGGM